MAKGDQEDVMNAAKSQMGTDSTAMNTAINNTQNRIGTPAQTVNGVTTPATGLLGQQQQQLGAATQQFQNFAGSGGVSADTSKSLGAGAGSIANSIPNLDPTLATALGPGPGSIAGSIPTPDYSAPAAGYGSMASTGGVNLGSDQATYQSLQQPNAVNQNIVGQLSNTSGMFGGVNNTIDQLKGIASTGGVSASDIGNINRPELLNEEATGGYSPTDIANIKKEGNSTIGSYYSSLQDSLARSKAASGYGPGFSAATQAAARQGAVDAGNNDVNTNATIAQNVIGNKNRASTTLAGNQLSLSGLTSANKQNALQTAGNLGTTETGQQIQALASAGGLNQTQQQIVMAAANGDVNAQAIIQSGKLAGLAGLTGTITAGANAAQAKAGLASSNTSGLADLLSKNNLGKAQLDSSNQTNLAGMTQQGQEFGASGLAGLYNSTNTQLSTQDQQLIQSLGLNADQQAALISIMQKNATAPGTGQQAFDNIMKGVGAGAGALGGLANYQSQFA